MNFVKIPRDLRLFLQNLKILAMSLCRMENYINRLVLRSSEDSYEKIQMKAVNLYIVRHLEKLGVPKFAIDMVAKDLLKIAPYYRSLLGEKCVGVPDPVMEPDSIFTFYEPILNVLKNSPNPCGKLAVEAFKLPTLMKSKPIAVSVRIPNMAKITRAEIPAPREIRVTTAIVAPPITLAHYIGLLGEFFLGAEFADRIYEALSKIVSRAIEGDTVARELLIKMHIPLFMIRRRGEIEKLVNDVCAALGFCDDIGGAKMIADMIIEDLLR